MNRTWKVGMWLITMVAAMTLFSNVLIPAQAGSALLLGLTDTAEPPTPTTDTNILPTPEPTEIPPTEAPPTEAPPTSEPQPRRTRQRAEQPTITLTPSETPVTLTPKAATATATPSVTPEGPITGGMQGLQLLLWGVLLAGIVGAGLALGLGLESRVK